MTDWDYLIDRVVFGANGVCMGTDGVQDDKDLGYAKAHLRSKIAELESKCNALKEEINEVSTQRSELLPLVLHAASNSEVKPSGNPGCFYCCQVVHSKRCPARLIVANLKGEE